MKNKYFIFIFIFMVFFLPNSLFAKSSYFQEGIDLFNQNKLEDAKFKFEQDISKIIRL